MNNIVYDELNNMQKEAVFHKDGPLLILAGAGSGKTKALTYRMAYLIEEGVNPYNILAITFTNKAASEMRQRVDSLIDYGAESVWVSTFHSLCVRILRRFIDNLGFERNFTIYDSDDQKQVIKEIVKRRNIDTKLLKERKIMTAISRAKDELVTPYEYLQKAGNDKEKAAIGTIYNDYQIQLKKSNALDFDDLIVKTIELFKEHSDVLDYYQDRFRYIMVDEYQDTNTAQFMLISLLASKYQNLCVVGDDDQSIYKFRGANINNILQFEKIFTDAKVIKLEQNYRSTKGILDVANVVIKNNNYRKDKALWTASKDDSKIVLKTYDNGFDEARGTVIDIEKKVSKEGISYNDCAILYRTNAQSRAFEEVLIRENVPYRIYGGINFYQRREIKDILAYLKTIDNARDDLAVKRIINIPKRGIGATSLSRIQEYAAQRDITFYDALLSVGSINSMGKAAEKINGFTYLIGLFRAKENVMGLKDFVEHIISETGYMDYLRSLDEDDDATEERKANIDEFITKVAAYEESVETPTLSGFLEEVALVADIDNMDSSNVVTLMTLHSAKGLEFENVYMVGMEDGLFPSYMSITSDDPTDIEEERRLCYVGITRAKHFLTLSNARLRMLRGEQSYNKISRFVREIPEELLTTDSSAKKSILAAAAPEPPKKINIIKNRTNYTIDDTVFDKPKTAGELGYGVGDKVKHVKFGVGTVTNIVNGGRDYEVTVNFEKFGNKKMFASFAKLVKI